MKKLISLVIIVALFLSVTMPIFAQEVEEDLTGQDVKTMTVKQVADFYKLDVKEYIVQLKSVSKVSQIEAESALQLLHDNFGLPPSLAKDVAVALIAQNEGDKNALINLTKEINGESKIETDYNFPLIGISLVVLYVGSLWLVKIKKLSLVAQRKFWNIALSLFFLSTGILGILLVLRISHGIIVPLPFNMLFWHVEAGLAFAVIAIFHALWHLSYFKAILKRS
ncbi:MAG: hypothetical protein WC503_02260 [Candidatus Shapirobacteria bacterium]